MKTVIKIEGVEYAKIIIAYADSQHKELVDFLVEFNSMEKVNEENYLGTLFADWIIELDKLGVGFQRIMSYEYDANPDLEITLKINGDIEFRKYNN